MAEHIWEPGELLARMDGTLAALVTQMAALETRMTHLESKAEERNTALNKRLDDKFVTKEEFAPYKAALNAVAGLVMVGVVGALLALVITRPHAP